MSSVRATYRLQMHAGFPLTAARRLVPYLSRLGVSHIHSSPILRARPGSAHGYDVADPRVVNPELGGEDALEKLVAELRAAGMGLVLDIVPNHMVASSDNPAWEDVLAHGGASAYARWFDIEWRTGERALQSRVLLPVLGDLRVRVLERGEITLLFEGGRFRVRYFEQSFPLDPSTLPPVLDRAAELARERGDPAVADAIAALASEARALPRRSVRSARGRERRRAQAAALAVALAALAHGGGAPAQVLAEAASNYQTGDDGGPRLRRLLDAQVYRLVYWRRAARELNYRRFFDVNDLIALHMEDPEVFAQTHVRLIGWARDGMIDGFRIDHPDGLLDPLGYFRQLAARAFRGERAGKPPVWVEKILSHGERLREDWPVAGTTGYDFLNEVEALFIDPAGYAAIEGDYRRLLRRPLDFGVVARLAKRHVLESGLSASVRRLAYRLLRLSGPDRPLRDGLTLHELVRAIVETIVYLPVYRTYVDDAHPVPRSIDAALLEGALAGARAGGRATSRALDVLEEALLAREGPMRAPDVEKLRLRFVQRFQQVSGPATAKGIEDTAFYAYVPLGSRSEVGGGPETPLAEAVTAFHLGGAHRADRWPAAMLAVTTHDTKRTADVRARLDVLSELPAEWEERVYHWRKWNRGHRVTGDRTAPDAITEYLYYQTLVGVWPVEGRGAPENALPSDECLASLRERLGAYMLKAVREAKQRTSWVDPDPAFEEALAGFVAATLDPRLSAVFLADVGAFARRIAPAGCWNSVARTALHLTSPGVPDLYQGDEIWNFALVDPDNRRPVDYPRREALLADVIERGEDSERRRAFLAEVRADPLDDRLKLHVTRTLLDARSRYPALFACGDYRPIPCEGPDADRVVAFARSSGWDALVVAVSRRSYSLLAGPNAGSADAWRRTSLAVPTPPSGRVWTSILTGERVTGDASAHVDLQTLFADLPAAVLVAETVA